jgi:hypothetical protein
MLDEDETTSDLQMAAQLSVADDHIEDEVE